MLRQLCDDTSDSVLIELQPHSGASSQSCRTVDADARCKRALTGCKTVVNSYKLIYLNNVTIVQQQ